MMSINKRCLLAIFFLSAVWCALASAAFDDNWSDQSSDEQDATGVAADAIETARETVSTVWSTGYYAFLCGVYVYRACKRIFGADANDIAAAFISHPFLSTALWGVGLVACIISVVVLAKSAQKLFCMVVGLVVGTVLFVVAGALLFSILFI